MNVGRKEDKINPELSENLQLHSVSASASKFQKKFESLVLRISKVEVSLACEAGQRIRYLKQISDCFD